MRRWLRHLIGLGGLVWGCALIVLVVWHVIWRPLHTDNGPQSWAASWSSDEQQAGAEDDLPPPFKDTFSADLHPRREHLAIRHPLHGEFRRYFVYTTPPQIEGAVLLHVRRTQDCTLSLSFTDALGDRPSSGVVVAVFARCRDLRRPYESGLAYEWDMGAGEQRIWADGRILSRAKLAGASGDHRMTFELTGQSVRGATDGKAPLTASDPRPRKGVVGFAGHGRPDVAFSSLSMDVPGASPRLPAPAAPAASAQVVALTAGGRFDERMDLRGRAQRDRAPTATSGLGRGGLQGAALPDLPRYIIHEGAMAGLTATSTDERRPTILRDTVLCLIDSHGARDCSVRSLLARLPLEPQGIPRSDRDSRSPQLDCLLVRVQDPAKPWGGCYAAVCDAARGSLELIRYDPSVADPHDAYDAAPPGAKLLARAAMPGPALGQQLWLTASGPSLSAGIGSRLLVSASDGTYPAGYVGFGARPDAPGVFSQLELRGGPFERQPRVP